MKEYPKRSQTTWYSFYHAKINLNKYAYLERIKGNNRHQLQDDGQIKQRQSKGETVKTTSSLTPELSFWH